MLEIVKNNSKENSKESFQIFMEELERFKFVSLKESDKIIYEEISNRKKVGLFKRKSVVEIQNGDILKKGDYISLYGLCNIIGKYLVKIYVANKKICYSMRTATKSVHNVNIKFEDNILSILDDNNKGVAIDCCALPKVVFDNGKVKYSYFKSTIYYYLPYIMKINKIIDLVNNNYNINKYTTLKIEADDLLNTTEITIILQFGEFAVYEVQISVKDNGCDFKCINTFSLDVNINKYLTNNGDEMLTNIFIKESDISEILDIFENI